MNHISWRENGWASPILPLESPDPIYQLCGGGPRLVYVAMVTLESSLVLTMALAVVVDRRGHLWAIEKWEWWCVVCMCLKWESEVVDRGECKPPPGFRVIESRRGQGLVVTAAARKHPLLAFRAIEGLRPGRDG